MSIIRSVRTWFARIQFQSLITDFTGDLKCSKLGIYFNVSWASFQSHLLPWALGKNLNLRYSKSFTTVGVKEKLEFEVFKVIYYSGHYRKA